MNPERLSLVIDAIYRATQRRDSWSDALELVADALDASDTLLLFIDWTRPDPIVSESVRADDVREVAQMLDIAPSTVHTNCKQIYRKLRVSGRTALVHALLEARPLLGADGRGDR